MTARRKTKQIAALPVGVYRTSKGWEAYVAAPRSLVLLGVYATKRAAVAARASYWKAKERAA
jgi:hypothetical protein